MLKPENGASVSPPEAAQKEKKKARRTLTVTRFVKSLVAVPRSKTIESNQDPVASSGCASTKYILPALRFATVAITVFYGVNREHVYE